MNIEEIKHKFPQLVEEIEILQSLGFSSRSGNWIESLDIEKAKIACWLVGRVDDDAPEKTLRERDTDALIGILSGQRSELWMEAATSLSLMATERHRTSLLSILATSSNPLRRNSAVYALSFLSICEVNGEVISKLTEIAANDTEAPAVRAQALEGLANKLRQDLPPNLYQQAVDVIIQSLDDTEAEIRFWACFAVGAIKIEEALPKLQILVTTDSAIVAGWWSVSEEAEDAITHILHQYKD